MSAHESNRQRPVFVYVLLAFLCIGLSGVLGFWLGGMIGKASRPYELADIALETPLEDPLFEIPEPVEWSEPPVYVYLEEASPEALKRRVEQAAAEITVEDGRAVRFFRFVAEVPLPWPEHDIGPDAALAAINAIAEGCADAEIILSIPLDPPAEWLEAHPESTMKIGGEAQPYVSIASRRWREEIRANIETLIGAVQESSASAQVKGYVLRCLKDGWWVQPEGYDRSEDNTLGFREWLTIRYETAEAFRSAWSESEIAIEMATVPNEQKGGEGAPIFYRTPADQRNIDFLRYVSESTAETIALLASQIKAIAGHETRVYAPYGFSFGPTANCAGHAALGDLLNSDIDGFVAPPGYGAFDLEESGGLLGPVHSAHHYAKQWFLLDDTLARAPAAEDGESLPKDAKKRQEHIFSVAVTQGLGLFCRIPAEDTPTVSRSTLDSLKVLKSLYSPAREAKPAEGMEPFGDIPSRQLTVVVDEASRFHQACDGSINQQLLQLLPGDALGIGVPVQVCLLSDLLAGNVAPTPFYLFLNVFALPPDNRELLHAIMRGTGATAIWVYAAGYSDGETLSADNVAATVSMGVKGFDEPVPAGSVVTLAGTWIPVGTEFGDGTPWAPSFYIDDEDVNVVATYAGSGEASVAIAFLGNNDEENTWTSVYCAVPAMPTGLLREILRMLDAFQYMRSAPPESDDFYYFGRNTLGIHARVTGERIIDLGSIYDVRDLLDPTMGWPEIRHLAVPVEAGQTRIFKVMPVAFPEEMPMPVMDGPTEAPPTAED